MMLIERNVSDGFYLPLFQFFNPTKSEKLFLVRSHYYFFTMKTKSLNFLPVQLVTSLSASPIDSE